MLFVEIMQAPTLHKLDTSKIPSQRRFMESQAPELMYSGAFAAGKTRILLEKGLFLSLKYPGNVGAVMRKTLVALKHTTMETLWRDVLTPELYKYYGCEFNKQSQILTFGNGSKIFFLGIDEPIKVGGLEVGWIGIDEAVELDEEDYIMLLGRCRLTSLGNGLKLPFRQVFLATNPGPDTHYLYKRFYIDKHGEVVESSSLENPFLPADFIERLKTFTGSYRERYVLGRWIGFEGLVYDNWSGRDMVISSFPIPKEWKRFRAIDYGYTNAFSCQWWAVCPDEPFWWEQGYRGMYLYRQIYMTQRTVPEHAEVINSYDEFISGTVSDWDAGDRALLQQHGIGTIKAIKDIVPGIQVVYNEITNGRVQIFRDSLIEKDTTLSSSSQPTSTEDEFALYRWADIPKNKNQKEIPQDKNNHGMDALRYMVATIGGFVLNPTPVVYGRRSSWITPHIGVGALGRQRHEGRRSWMKA